MGQFLFKRQFHQLFGWRRHILESLSEGNDGKAYAFKILNHLYSAPAVKGDFLNVVFLTKLLDEFLDVSVMNDISLGRL